MILTNDEIDALRHLGGGISPRAVESAVLAKLAAGVSVEPDFDHLEAGIAFVSYRQETLNTAIAAAHAAGRKSVHDSCVDLWKDEVIAAARAQAIKDCEDAIETANARRVLYVPDCIDAIRALLGKEAT